MTFSVRQCDLKRLNSATKYPSIPTYHTLDPKNGLLLDTPFNFEGSIIATEKIDGTNARIIVLPDDSFIIGSREELLHAKGDLIFNPALGIVAALKQKASDIQLTSPNEIITVFYCEVYGGKVTAASKQYTGSRQVGFRLFDVAVIDLAILEQSPQKISKWRQQGGQSFLDENELSAYSEKNGFELTPRLVTLNASDLPSGLEQANDFLERTLSKSRCLLDDNAGGRPEGIVVRTSNRSQIAKLRFQDYRKTLKRRKS